MTNTLHRRGSLEELSHDFIMFAIPARGINEAGCKPKLQQFMRIALRHGPVNVGDARQGQRHSDDFEKLVAGLTDRSVATATFASREALLAALRDVQAADLGISINVTGLIDTVDGCCRAIGRQRHGVEHSLGIKGAIDRLPNRNVLAIGTLCGHGMVSFNLIQRVVQLMKLNRLSPAEGAQMLRRPCVCGAFNPERAREILEQMCELG